MRLGHYDHTNDKRKLIYMQFELTSCYYYSPPHRILRLASKNRHKAHIVEHATKIGLQKKMVSAASAALKYIYSNSPYLRLFKNGAHNKTASFQDLLTLPANDIFRRRAHTYILDVWYDGYLPLLLYVLLLLVVMMCACYVRVAQRFAARVADTNNNEPLRGRMDGAFRLRILSHMFLVFPSRLV